MSEFHHKLVQRKVRFDFSDTPPCTGFPAKRKRPR
ncbi:hypothetical protein BANRA_03636 [Pseudomonas aeruginosa]|nr:hypothetical protein BANRA_03636 [Pseudomonas aeruginosa]